MRLARLTRGRCPGSRRPITGVSVQTAQVLRIAFPTVQHIHWVEIRERGPADARFAISPVAPGQRALFSSFRVLCGLRRLF